jgi:flagellar biosynthesis protein FlhF
MTTQVFRGRTLAEAKKAASLALGPDAVVLTTRRVRRPGVSGLLGGVDVEIAAAAVPATEAGPAAGKGPFASAAYVRSQQPDSRDGLATLRSELRAEIRAMKVALSRTNEPSNELVAEILAMREALAQFAPPAAKGDKASAVIRARGIEGGAVAAIARSMRATREGSAASLEERFRDAVAEVIGMSAFPLAGEGRTVIAAVGPAGVGKTTTIAKLATMARIGGKTVTLVTCDTFRVGGVEQLRRYADLLGVAFEVARSATELGTIVARAGTNVVLVDTSGREPAADAAERLLAAAPFKAKKEFEGFTRHVLLCVPASIRAVDTARVVKAFSATNPTALAMTKLDETDAPSGLVHAAFSSKLPISVLCAGQRVPEDIAPATTGAVLDALTRIERSGASARDRKAEGNSRAQALVDSERPSEPSIEMPASAPPRRGPTLNGSRRAAA